jgi:hypothetical protein
MSESSYTPFVINRIGSVERSDAKAHFMAGHSGMGTACGKRAVSAWGCTKDSGISNVDCPDCWEIKHAKASA